MKRISFIILGFILTGHLSYSQNSNAPKDKSKLYRLERIKDKTILQEIKPLLFNYSWDTIPIDLTPIPLIDTNAFYATFRGHGFDIMINCEYFYPALHLITYDSAWKTHTVKEIDRHVFWGTDDDMPQTKVHEIIIKSNGINIQVPDSATSGMYNPVFGGHHDDVYNFAYLSKDKRRLYLKMNNSDGAGFYQVVWIFIDNKYYDRVIDPGP